MSFLQWLESFYFPGHFPLALIGSYLALRANKFRLLFLYFSISIFSTLSIADLYLHFFYSNEIQPSSISESIASNAIGAPLLAFIICMLLHFSRKISKQFGPISTYRTSLTSLVLGSIFVFAIYVTSNNLFPVTKSVISARLTPPFEGNYVPSKEISRFGVLTASDMPLDKFSWTGKFSGLNLVSTSKSNNLEGAIYLFEGCPNAATSEIIKNLPFPTFSFEKEEKIKLSIKEGMGSLSMYSENKSAGGWTSSDPDVGMFSIKQDEKNQLFNITKFISDETVITHDGWTGVMFYRIDSYLFNQEDLVNHTFSITTNKNTSTFTIEPSKYTKINERIKCTPIKPYSFKARIPISTIILKISSPTPVTFEDLKLNNNTRVTGLSGWISASHVDMAEMAKYLSIGKVQMVSLKGKFQDILIDQNQQVLRENNWLFVQGDELKASWDKSVLTIDGKTEITAIEGSRLSKTRWEKISPAIKWLFFLIPISFGFVLRSFISAWAMNEDLIAQH